jgi:hypothetical protein
MVGANPHDLAHSPHSGVGDATGPVPTRPLTTTSSPRGLRQTMASRRFPGPPSYLIEETLCYIVRFGYVKETSFKRARPAVRTGSQLARSHCHAAPRRPVGAASTTRSKNPARDTMTLALGDGCVGNQCRKVSPVRSCHTACAWLASVEPARPAEAGSLSLSGFWSGSGVAKRQPAGDRSSRWNRRSASRPSGTTSTIARRTTSPN